MNVKDRFKRILRLRSKKHKLEQVQEQDVEPAQESEPPFDLAAYKHITEKPPESGSSLLLSLPLELRLMVYDYLLISEVSFKELEYLGSWEQSKRVTGIHTSILKVSKQIHDEAKEIVYRQNHFKFKSIFLFCSFTSQIQPYFYKQIRRLHISHEDSIYLQPRELARDWNQWFGSLIAFDNLRSLTLEVDYKVLLPRGVALTWGGNFQHLGRYHDYEHGVISCIAASYANWHKGLRVWSCGTGYLRHTFGRLTQAAYKRAILCFTDAGEGGRKRHAEYWTEEQRQRACWSKDNKDSMKWHRYIYNRLPAYDERELEVIRWPASIQRPAASLN